MSFTHSLIAITLEGGRYSVHSSLDFAWLDIRKIDGLQKIDVSQNSSLLDYLAPMAVWQAKRCLPDRVQDAERIAQWLDDLPSSVYFVLMHSAEFESGYGD